MTLYMKVSDDKYELPIAVAESYGELATMTKRSESTIRNIFWKQRQGTCVNSSYVIVEVQEDS